MKGGLKTEKWEDSYYILFHTDFVNCSSSLGGERQFISLRVP